MIWAIGVFTLGFLLFMIGLSHTSRPTQKGRSWVCPDPGCPQRYHHARYMVTHIMDVHPDLAPWGKR